MRDILLKRNELKKKSLALRTIKFDPSMKRKDVSKSIEEQNILFNQYKFYDSFIKKREEIKNEKKESN